MFSYKNYEICKNTYLEEHLRTTASGRISQHFHYYVSPQKIFRSMLSKHAKWYLIAAKLPVAALEYLKQKLSSYCFQGIF